MKTKRISPVRCSDLGRGEHVTNNIPATSDWHHITAVGDRSQHVSVPHPVNIWNNKWLVSHVAECYLVVDSSQCLCPGSWRERRSVAANTSHIWNIQTNFTQLTLSSERESAPWQQVLSKKLQLTPPRIILFHFITLSLLQPQEKFKLLLKLYVYLY